MSQGMGGAFASSAAYQLLSTIKNKHFNTIYTKLNIEDISDKLGEIISIEKAIKAQVQIECRYDTQRKEPYTTTLAPLKIANYNRNECNHYP
ncbi:MAG: hypothetical protein U9N49_05055 [Campylobacterota bacterium]|nr:hypothetical protein [Campylobacterota bacterium]